MEHDELEQLVARIEEVYCTRFDDVLNQFVQSLLQDVLQKPGGLTHSGIDKLFAAGLLPSTTLPVDFDDIRWVRPGKLYRSTFQSALEHSILRSTARGEPPTYSKNASTNCPTRLYCSPDPSTGLTYVTGRDPERKTFTFQYSPGRNPHWPFTQHPIGMEINALPYRKNLVIEQGSHDAIAITTPIQLEDITLIYSSHIDAFGSMNGILSPFDLIDSHRRVQEFVAMHNMRRDQHFLYNIYREPRKTTLALHRLAFGLQYAIHEHEVRKLEAAIHAIAEKLHLPEEMLNNIAEKNRGCRRQPVVQ